MEINHGGGAARGLVLLIGGVAGGKRRQPVRPEAALGLLATLPPEALLGSPIPASVLQLADPADPQLLLAHLQTAARTPGPVLVALVGQLTADRRRSELHLALAQTTRDNVRYSALPWAWLADQLRSRPLGTTTVLADLVADPEAWAVLQEHGPDALTAGLPLVGQVSPPGTTGDGYAPPYTRALVDHLRRADPGARPAALHHLAGHSGLPAGALLLTGEFPSGSGETPASGEAPPTPELAAAASTLSPAPAVFAPPHPDSTGPAPAVQAPALGLPAPAVHGHPSLTAAPVDADGRAVPLPAAPAVADRMTTTHWPTTSVPTAATPVPAVPAPPPPGTGAPVVAAPSPGQVTAPLGAIPAVPAPAAPAPFASGSGSVAHAVPALAPPGGVGVPAACPPVAGPTRAIPAVPAPAAPTPSAVPPAGISPAAPAAARTGQWADAPPSGGVPAAGSMRTGTVPSVAGPAGAGAFAPATAVGEGTDPRPGIAAALHRGDLPRAAYLVADWERLLLRHQGPRAPQLADVAEAQAQLALAGGDLDRATERLIESARLRMQQLPPQAPEVVTAVDNAVAIWGRLPRESALRHGVALLTLCRAVQASAGGGRLHDVEARLARLSERTGLLRRGR